MATIILLYGIQLNVCNFFFYFSETEPSQNNEIGSLKLANKLELTNIVISKNWK